MTQATHSTRAMVSHWQAAKKLLEICPYTPKLRLAYSIPKKPNFTNFSKIWSHCLLQNLTQIFEYNCDNIYIQWMSIKLHLHPKSWDKKSDHNQIASCIFLQAKAYPICYLPFLLLTFTTSTCFVPSMGPLLLEQFWSVVGLSWVTYCGWCSNWWKSWKRMNRS